MTLMPSIVRPPRTPGSPHLTSLVVPPIRPILLFFVHCFDLSGTALSGALDSSGGVGLSQVLDLALLSVLCGKYLY